MTSNLLCRKLYVSPFELSASRQTVLLRRCLGEKEAAEEKKGRKREFGP